MRVVWVTHNYPRFRGDIAGAFLHPLAVALRGRGVDIRVVAPSDGGAGGMEELDGVPVRRVRYARAARERLAYGGMNGTSMASIGGVVTFDALRRALRRGARDDLRGAGPGLVHAHWWLPGGLAAPPEIPMVLTCHGSDVQLLERSGLARWIGRSVFRRAKVVTTVSRALAAIVKRRTGIDVGDDAIQPMPVVNVERPWSIGGGGVVVIGRLTRQKRVDLAIDAFAQARELGVACTLSIVGDGPERANLELLATERGVESDIRFLGEIAPGDVPTILANADCCIMPAVGEGFGLAAAEALMQGVPVIACRDGGGLTDIVVPGIGGLIVDPAPSAIAEALLDLLANAAAADGARQAGTAWRARLSADAVADRCLTWYEEALDA
ncbi:MAG TPA: glycosyltransferase family 4 protein [Gemmatimonadales bacterium]|jgi:glycosyltransferase involved in cell wall biosynthesis